MKLNRKGYLTVEVILASVAAIGIAFFLMEITIKLVNITDDTYVDTDLLTDKALIIENIKENLEKDTKDASGGGIDSMSCTRSKCNINFCYGLKRYIEVKDNQIIYGDGENNEALYNKKINDKILSGNASIQTNAIKNQIGEVTVDDNAYFYFKITADNKFSNNNFEANIVFFNYKEC